MRHDILTILSGLIAFFIILLLIYLHRSDPIRFVKELRVHLLWLLLVAVIAIFLSSLWRWIHHKRPNESRKKKEITSDEQEQSTSPLLLFSEPNKLCFSKEDFQKQLKITARNLLDKDIQCKLFFICPNCLTINHQLKGKSEIKEITLNLKALKEEELVLDLLAKEQINTPQKLSITGFLPAYGAQVGLNVEILYDDS